MFCMAFELERSQHRRSRCCQRLKVAAFGIWATVRRRVLTFCKRINTNLPPGTWLQQLVAFHEESPVPKSGDVAGLACAPGALSAARSACMCWVCSVPNGKQCPACTCLSQHLGILEHRDPRASPSLSHAGCCVPCAEVTKSIDPASSALTCQSPCPVLCFLSPPHTVRFTWHFLCCGHSAPE